MGELCISDLQPFFLLDSCIIRLIFSVGVKIFCNVIAPRSLRILEFRKKFKYYQSVICMLMDFLSSHNAVFFEEYELFLLLMNENESFFLK